MKVAQGVLAHLDGLVVPATGDEPIADEVLGAGRDRAGTTAVSRTRIVALESAHHRRTESTGKHRSLPQRFGHPAPSGLLGDVQHRGEGPGDPVKAGLGGSEPRGAEYEVLVPGGGEPERDWEDRPMPVDDIAREQKGDPQA